MCGIVGYIGHNEAYPILIKGLKRLEYRGYDSAGVALINNDGGLNVYKAIWFLLPNISAKKWLFLTLISKNRPKRIEIT